MNTNPSIAMIGAGAIGGITAAYMAAAGLDVELVCKHEDTAAAANGEGLLIRGVRGEKRMRVRAVTEIEQLSAPKDIIMIAVKAYDMPDAARRALPFLKPDGLAVSMQNGICTDAMAAVVGPERTVGCVVGWGATMISRGALDMTSEGEFIIGAIAPGMGEKLEALKRALSAFIETRISEGIVSELYSKMIVNSCITSMGVTSGLTLGEMMKRRLARNIFLGIIREAVAVANAMKLTLPPYGGKLDYYKLADGSSGFSRLRNHLLIRIVGIKYRRLKSSSLQSLQRGKPTEIDYFNGYIAQKGAALGVPTPVNTTIVGIVKQIEAGKRKPDPGNFQDESIIRALKG